MNNQNALLQRFGAWVQKGMHAIASKFRRFPASLFSAINEREIIRKLNISNPNYEKNLLVVSLVIISGIVLLGVKTYQNNLSNQDTYQRVDHTRQVLYDAEQISAAMKDLELGVRGYVITGDYTFLGPFYSTRQTIFTRINNLKNLSGENTAQQARLDSLKNHLQQKLEFLERSISIRKNKGALAAESFIIKNPDINRIVFLDNIIGEIKAEENKNLTVRKEANADSNEIFSRLNMILVAVLILLVTATFLALRHNTQISLKAKLLLEKNKQILQSIIDNTSSIIYVKDMYGRFSLVNKQFSKTYGITAEEVIGKTMYDINKDAFADENTRNDDQVIEERKLIELEENISIDGKIFHYYSIKFPLINRNGELYAIATISTDITDIIQKQNLQRQKEIIENKIEAQENERKEIGIELHDNISQLLASAKMMLDTALYNVEQKDARLEKARNDVFSAINETRKLSHSLVSPVIPEQQITDAIQKLTHALTLSGKMKLQLKFSGRKQLNNLDEKLKLTIYRITQEQINNIIKYSRAANVLVQLDASNNHILLKISDDGVGFDAATKSSGIGFKNIASRVDLFTGTMKITASPGQGCTLEIIIPFSNAGILPAA
ncbi:CHASE3 domain-containing protein [Flavihumibacter profundi]|jgi:two-component system, NarL family, sensor kinase|uniref:CHASE3 domain-containing protein n=1 Tax=Flavihumibacter profundi TaxID=2716883 RepID=UPI001CC5AE0B|nr:CHASE3 domain-containing protein [Flavihumibacter profundi]MBZ5859297.1 CHASE3 domain-containing protein [Flavihumibacter profundi]